MFPHLFPQPTPSPAKSSKLKPISNKRKQQLLRSPHHPSTSPSKLDAVHDEKEREKKEKDKEIAILPPLRGNRRDSEDRSLTLTAPLRPPPSSPLLGGLPYDQSPFSFIDRLRSSSSPRTSPSSSSPSHEFVYLIPNPNGFSSPYNLQLVSPSFVSSQLRTSPSYPYYTMSRAGVTHFNGNVTSFQSLVQWEREYFLFSKVMSLPFFRDFRLWKAFFFWFKLLRTTKMNRAKRVLREELPTLNPHLRPCIINMKAQLFSASKWSLFQISPAEPLTLGEFVERQEQHKQHLSQMLLQLQGEIRSMVERACRDDLQSFLQSAGFRQLTDSEREADDGFLMKVSHAERAANRTKCRKLTKFIRLVDYLMIDNLITLAFERISDLLVIIDEKKREKNADEETKEKEKESKGDDENNDEFPLFIVDLDLSPPSSTPPSSLCFRPECRDFQMLVDSAIDTTIRRLSLPLRSLLDKQFNKFTKANDEEIYRENEEEKEEGELMKSNVSSGGFSLSSSTIASSIESFVLDSPQYRDLKFFISSAISAAFQRASQFVTSFDEYKSIYLSNERLDVSSFSSSPIHMFSEMINTFHEQQAKLNSMPTESTVGIIRIDSSKLKSMFTPSPSNRLNELERLLPLVAREKCRELFEKLRDANTRLSHIPATVEEFVQLMSFLQSVQSSADDDAAQFVYLQDLYHLCIEFGIRVPDTDKAAFEKLSQTRQTFKTSLLLSEAGIHGNVERFSKELENEIPHLNESVRHLRDELKESASSLWSSVTANTDDVISFLEDKDSQLIQLEEKAQRFQSYQEILQLDSAEFNDLKNLRLEMDLLLSIWHSQKTWAEFTTSLYQTRLDKVDVEDVAAQVSMYQKVYTKAKRVLESNPVVSMLKEKIGQMQMALPVVADLRRPQLQPHHWDAINHLLAYEIQKDPEFTMGTLMSLKAIQYRNEIAAISNKAQQEAALQEMLGQVVDTWTRLSFPVIAHKEGKDVFILGNIDDILTALEDTLITLATIASSRFVDPIKDSVADWNNKLLLFQETTNEWIQLQRQWIYLENIFASQDIARQLPDEFSLFSKVDRAWREIMRRTNDQPNCIIAGTYVGLKDNFHSYNLMLERVNKQLESFLETRRQQFPRFYFLSSDELIKILSQSKNVTAVQPHLRKCFENIYKLEFGADGGVGHSRDIKAMISAEGERVTLGANLKARGPAESWLPALEADMVKTMRKFIKRGVLEYERMVPTVASDGRLTLPGRSDWLLQSFGQVVFVVSQIFWSRGIESALADHSTPPSQSLSTFRSLLTSHLQELTSMVRGDLTDIDRRKIVALITTEVHSRDIVQKLIEENVTSVKNFQWQQQLRFYWDSDDDDCIIKQSFAQFPYGYEYMGVTSRLVITPLTDRCWMTITGALNLKFGAAPAGPAGTGKTESTKDLAKAMGLMCVVLNCSEQVSYKTTGKLISGLAQSGVWACLDEFNRIDVEVLSVISQQLLQVRQALLQNATEFNFQGTNIRLKPSYGCMITMNPGYAGRTELPDNLKVLFRPVAMMIPDYAQIAEIMLYAEGFDSASVLSKKMVQLYKLSSEQLSQQDHYDFGLRAVKSVLSMAGSLKRLHPDVNEDVVLIKAMKDSNVPKFLKEDLPLFNAIVQDLFPTVEIEESTVQILQSTLESTVADEGLQVLPTFINKCLQLWDTLNVRFGVMIVGPTGSAKSACHEALKKAINSLNAQGNINEKTNNAYPIVHSHTLNPKCVDMNELYGCVDSLSQEWTEGLASSILRSAVSDASADNHWVIFDGPVDASWIENMNSVLDDNQTLCLVNGERIKLRQEMRLLFEVEDLAVASPATVSRCGMVYMDPSDLGAVPYIRSWVMNNTKLLEAVNNEVENYLLNTLQTKFGSAIDFLRSPHSQCKEVIPTVDISLASTCCSLFESLFTAANGVDFTDSVDNLRLIIDYLVSFSFAWGIGGALDVASQKVFSKHLGELFPHIRPPTSFYDVFVDIRNRSWRSWESIVPSFEFDMRLSFSQMVVPTVESVKYQLLLQTLLLVDKPTFFTGPTGVGKSIVVRDFMVHPSVLPQYVSIPFTFSAATTARKTQESIESKLVKYRKTLYGAPSGKKALLFIDDVNMPAKEFYGSIPVVELLRQVVEYGGVYDRSQWFWKNMVDTTMVCAGGIPGGGRNELSKRFTRHFAMLAIPQPSEHSLRKIFTSILSGFLSSFKPQVQKLRDTVVSSTIELYDSICAELLPTPSKSHYTFNLRDISKVFQGLCQISPPLCLHPETFARGWIHECCRSFSDRLVNDEDRSWFSHRIVVLLQKNFLYNWSHEDLFERGKKKNEGSSNVSSSNDDSKESKDGSVPNPNRSDDADVMWGDWMKPGSEKVYEENSRGLSALSHLLEDYQDEMNEHRASARLSSSSSGLSTLMGPSTLVFFPDAIAHVSRICRVLRQPRGNVLLVGVGGSGKRSLTRLAAYMEDMKCAEMEIVKGFGYSEFQEFIKACMSTAGVQGKDLVVLINESQIIEERFLEDLNNLLNNGDVPNLFSSDELNKLIDDLTPVLREEQAKKEAEEAAKNAENSKNAAANDAAVPATSTSTTGSTTSTNATPSAPTATTMVAGRAGIYNSFIERVRQHLHIVICLSPVGESFRRRCRQFPSLINCTTIDWFNRWPISALQNVAAKMLKEMEFPSDEVRKALVDLCVTIHTDAEAAAEKFEHQLRRKVYLTPKSFLDFLNLYAKLLSEKRDEIQRKRQFLLNGLSKLHETKSLVGDLQDILVKIRPVLVEKSKETETLLQQIEVDQTAADKVRVVVEDEEKAVNARAQEVREVQLDAQADLDLAMPALRAAMRSLEKLKKAEISEVKSMQNPPTGVVKTMEAVCILLGHAPEWSNAQKVLANANFLKQLKEFDKDHIDPKIIKKVQKYTSDPELTEERMMTVSRAATAILMWINAMVEYSKVAKVVAPKRARVDQLNVLLEEANGKLQEKQSQLAEVMAKVNALKSRCDATIAEKSHLDAKMQQTERRLDRASKLITGLAEESIRWQAEAEAFLKQRSNLVGDVFLSAAQLSYCGPFIGEYREELTAKWTKAVQSLNIPSSTEYSLSSTLSSPLEIRQWTINGLPNEHISIDSAILTRYGYRWPLCIDPQEQAKRWIKMEYKNKLIVTKQSNRDFTKNIEYAVSNGYPLLIEDISESLEASLDPLLAKETFVKGDITYLHIFDKDIEYDPRFRLFITTKLSNPHLLPEVQMKILLLNFTVTFHGLQDQLMGEVVRKERPDIEEKKNRLVILQAKDRKQLNEIEDRILQLLNESSGNILDDENLIETLGESKFTAAVIQDRVKESLITQQDLNVIRERYRPVALRGTILYFVVSDLSHIDPMYQYSLPYFLRLFHYCMDHAVPSDVLEKRLANLASYLTQYVYNNICRGLFERHKLIFAFILCVGIHREKGEIANNEWRFLIWDNPVPAAHSSTLTPVANPMPELFPDRQWDFVISIDSHLPSFKGFLVDFLSNIHQWRSFITHPSPLTVSLPSTWQTKLSPFQRLLLIKALRPEKLLTAAREYVRHKLGDAFIESSNSSASLLDDVYKDTDPSTPIIFILSQGADPTSLVLRFARDKNMMNKFHLLSLGQGQGEAASRLIESARVRGEWVMLQNCHLAKSWMNTLEDIVGSFAPQGSAAGDSDNANSASAAATSSSASSSSASIHRLHPDFRLFLTSMPSPSFPPSVLQRGVKMTNESPSGIRANVLRTLNNMISEQDIKTSVEEDNIFDRRESTTTDDGNADDPNQRADVQQPPPSYSSFSRLLFSLSFFHSVVQERKKFNALGWCKQYEFNDADLETAMLTLRTMMDKEREEGKEEEDTKEEKEAELQSGANEKDNRAALIPFDALRYVIGEINYGGRVTDFHDRKLLMAILKKYITMDIFNNAYSFSSSGKYRIPEIPTAMALSSSTPLDIFTQYVQSLPSTDDPEAFGMHSNAAVSYQRQSSQSMVETILSIQPRDVIGGDGKSTDMVVLALAADIEQKMPPQLDKSKLNANVPQAASSPSSSLPDSLTTVLFQEIDRYNRLLQEMSLSLQSLQKAIKGEMVMSNELDLMYVALLNNQLPSIWAEYSFASLKPLDSWIRDLNSRISFLSDWVLNGRPPSFWLSGFFFPQGFLTGVLQQHARKYKISIDSLGFTYKVIKNVYTKEELMKYLKDSQSGDDHLDGVFVEGLYLEGARWDNDHECVVDPFDGELISTVPIVHFVPTEKATLHGKPMESKHPYIYECPLYKTSARAGVLSTTGHSTNYVISIGLPSMSPSEDWILRGTAAISQLDI